MIISIKKIFYWMLNVIIIVPIIILAINYNNPKGIWLGLKPIIFEQFKYCITESQKDTDIKNTSLWIERLKKRIPEKNQSYNDLILNLKKLKSLNNIVDNSIRLAIEKNENLRNIEVAFLNDAINFNKRKLIMISETNDVDYCLAKHNIIWKMNYYRNSATYSIRKILFNEDKIYWNDYFIKYFGKSIY